MVRTSSELLQRIPERALLGKRENAFGIEAVVERSAVSNEVESVPVTLEELFVMMEKEVEAS